MILILMSKLQNFLPLQPNAQRMVGRRVSLHLPKI